jgi:hypothetical protein
MLYGALDDCLTSLNPKSAKQQQQQADSIRLVYAKWVAKHCPEVVPIDSLCMSDADGEALLPAFSSIYEECRAASDAGGIQFPYMMLACEFEIQKDTFSQVRALRPMSHTQSTISTLARACLLIQCFVPCRRVAGCAATARALKH